MPVPELIRGLMEPSAYPHEVAGLELIETHISWVILTGRFAYKVKKPVALGFLDFSSLERRKFFCEEELRVNRRTAPDLYLDVVSIGIGAEGARIGARPATEYAVRMRQFPHESRLDRCLQAKAIGVDDMHSLASTIARFHRNLPSREQVDPAFEFERIVKPARNNFVYLDPDLFGDDSQQKLAVIESWTSQQAEALRGAFEQRALDGFIRECHGDLHLENLLVSNDQFIPFDAIEFNHELRWIDTANDIAFLAMDLMARNRADFAYSLLNSWLEETGDYGSLAVMRFYLAYRCMVRAVVTSIRQQQRSGSEPGSFRLGAAAYIDLAASLVDTPPPFLYLMHGFSGSGKSWFSEHLVRTLPALRVRSDLERKRLPGVTVKSDEAQPIGGGDYSPEMTDRTYRALARHCESGLRSGFSMIADATFLAQRHRDLFRHLAETNKLRLVILDCTAPEHVLRDRILSRQNECRDASEANLAVLEYQLGLHDPLSDTERALAIAIDSTQDVNDLIARVPGFRHS